MGFIFKFAFWGFVALVALPAVAPSDLREETAVAVVDTQQAGPGETAGADAGAGWLTAISGLAFDVATLCARQPVVCEHGSHLAEAALIRAEHGLRIAHAMIMQRRAATGES